MTSFIILPEKRIEKCYRSACSMCTVVSIDSYSGQFPFKRIHVDLCKRYLSNLDLESTRLGS